MTSDYSTFYIVHIGNMIRHVSSSLAKIALEIFLHIHKHVQSAMDGETKIILI